MSNDDNVDETAGSDRSQAIEKIADDVGEAIADSVSPEVLRLVHAAIYVAVERNLPSLPG